MMTDPLFYLDEKYISAIGGSIGLVFDKYNNMSTILEVTKRWYDSGYEQQLVNISQTLRASQNVQLKFKYDYKERSDFKIEHEENSFSIYLNYYF